MSSQRVVPDLQKQTAAISDATTEKYEIASG